MTNTSDCAIQIALDSMFEFRSADECFLTITKQTSIAMRCIDGRWTIDHPTVKAKIDNLELVAGQHEYIYLLCLYIAPGP